MRAHRSRDESRCEPFLEKCRRQTPEQNLWKTLSGSEARILLQLLVIVSSAALKTRHMFTGAQLTESAAESATHDATPESERRVAAPDPQIVAIRPFRGAAPLPTSGGPSAAPARDPLSFGSAAAEVPAAARPVRWVRRHSCGLRFVSRPRYFAATPVEAAGTGHNFAQECLQRPLVKAPVQDAGIQFVAM